MSKDSSPPLAEGFCFVESATILSHVILNRIRILLLLVVVFAAAGTAGSISLADLWFDSLHMVVIRFRCIHSLTPGRYSTSE